MVGSVRLPGARIRARGADGSGGVRRCAGRNGQVRAHSEGVGTLWPRVKGEVARGWMEPCVPVPGSLTMATLQPPSELSAPDLQATTAVARNSGAAWVAPILAPHDAEATLGLAPRASAVRFGEALRVPLVKARVEERHPPRDRIRGRSCLRPGLRQPPARSPSCVPLEGIRRFGFRAPESVRGCHAEKPSSVAESRLACRRGTLRSAAEYREGRGTEGRGTIR